MHALSFQGWMWCVVTLLVSTHAATATHAQAIAAQEPASRHSADHSASTAEGDVVPAPPRDALSTRAALLHALIQREAREERVSRLRLQGMGALLLGGIASSYGGYVLLDGAGMDQTLDRGIIGASMFTSGLLFAWSGIRLLVADETFAELRLRRFEAARARGPLSQVQLARFETELELTAWFRRDQRISEGFMDIGMAIAGLTMIGFAASGLLEDDTRGYTTTIGVVFSVLGIWQAIVALTGESGAEERWRRYVADVEIAQRAQP